MREDRQSNFFFTIGVTFIWGLIAHGYCYFNLLFSHDSMMIYQTDSGLQLSLGRFLHLLYWKFRGKIYAPALVGFLSLIFLGISIWLILRLFREESKAEVCVISGILVTNVTVSLLNATYLHEADVYMLSLLASVLAVYLNRTVKFGILPGIACIACSLALYQSYFQVAVFLTMLLAILDILEQKELTAVLKSGFRGLIMIVAGLVLYAAALKLVLMVTGTDISGEYNSLTRVADGLSAATDGFVGAYAFAGKWFLHPVAFHSGFIGIVNLLVIISSLAMIAAIAFLRKIRGWNLALLAVLTVLAPFGMNVIFLISNGLEHQLMIYSFFLVYVFAWMLCRELTNTPEGMQFLSKVKCGVVNPAALLLVLIIMDNIIFANQIYLKKDLEYRNTMSTMNRILNRMELTDGYVLGETPVAIVGDLRNSPLNQQREGFPYKGVGLKRGFSVTYSDTLQWYFQNVLAYPVEFVDLSDLPDLQVKQTAEQMPAFPAPDCCRIVDGVMLVKLSEPFDG